MEYRGLALTHTQNRWFFEDMTLANTHHGKHYDQEKLSLFMKKYSLSNTKASTPSINHVITGQARRNSVNGYKISLHEEKRKSPDAIGWFDHSKLFYHKPTQTYVMTTQPYDLTLEAFQALEEFCSQNGLKCYISYKDAWHYPGRTPLVAICKQEVFEQIFKG